jgi:hypothetical protein
MNCIGDPAQLVRYPSEADTVFIDLIDDLI